jgi:hypothetical protein
MSRGRALGWLSIVVGLGLALAVQLHAPVGVPLYDGVVVAEPYRYLHPTGDQPDDPTSASSTEHVAGGKSPIFAIATDEQPPQAQLVSQDDAFQVAPGTTELKISITPVDPAVQPTSGSIAGNVYRFAVTDQSGNPLVAKPCDTCRSLVLRAPEDVTDGAIGHLVNGAWVAVATFHAGTVAMFQANADTLGDFAVLVGGAPPDGNGGGSSGLGLDPLVFGGVALGLFFVAVAVLFWYRRRPPPVPVVRLGPGRGRIPSKRKAPRRPPSGRSGS